MTFFMFAQFVVNQYCNTANKYILPIKPVVI